ncbi:MAG: sugar-transfer associated ATP-grasp domain-containing protein [Hyphomicrobiaceae bacterium]|nr:sugar-transfer associated ATP-grasp domain-containing protein [Hyphomicrobiaceae bacterium]
MSTSTDQVIAPVRAGDAAMEERSPKPKRVLDTSEPEAPLPLPLLLKMASDKHGKPLGQMVTEIAKLGFGPGKIDVEEYFSLRLFDDKALAGQDKRSFMGMRTCKTVGHDANQHSHWFACVSDKLVFNTLLGGYGLPVLATRGFYHARFKLPAFGAMRTAADIHRFLATSKDYPLFGKPTGAAKSLGIVALDGYDGTTGEVLLGDGRRVSAHDLAEEIAAAYDTGYLFQERGQPHPEVRALSGDSIATVRVYTLYTEKGPRVFRACWKLPAGRNVADNFWRGNILAALDMETGAITRAIQGSGLNQVELETHPDTGARLIDAKVPDWQRLVDLALQGAEILDTMPLLGWDIAPAASGPVLIEANNTPDFRLVQMAENRGAYDATLKVFLAETAKYWEESGAIDKNRKKSLKQQSLDRVLSALRKRA